MFLRVMAITSFFQSEREDMLSRRLRDKSSSCKLSQENSLDQQNSFDFDVNFNQDYFHFLDFFIQPSLARSWVIDYSRENKSIFISRFC